MEQERNQEVDLSNQDVVDANGDHTMSQRLESASKLEQKAKIDQQEMVSLDKNQSMNQTTTNDMSSSMERDIADTSCAQRPYPMKVFFIIANEFCERFSFYGLRTILVLYLRNVLNFSDSSSTVIFHLFATMCHLTPVLGAILADSVWGKFKTILYLSVVYVFGELILIISSIIWNHGTASIDLTLFGLLMIGLGSGGIKPCVGALGGDQYLPNEQRRRDLFFPMFYGSIHLASLISVFISPILRSDFQCAGRSDCYPFAFSIPCGLMLIAILVFYSAKSSYVLIPLPEENVILAFCKCIWYALKRKIFGQKQPDFYEIKSSWSARNKSISISSSSSSIRNKHIMGLNHKTNNHWLHLASDKFSSKSIQDFKIVLGILLLFLPIPVFYTLHDQQGSLWTLQANRMDGRLFNTGFVFDPDQILVANPLLILANIPIFQFIIYPTLNKLGVSTKPIPRMTMGGLSAASAFVVSGLIENRIQHFLPAASPPSGRANLILVNGFSDCSINSLTISYHFPNMSTAQLSDNYPNDLEPLKTRSIDVLSNQTSELEYYQLKFSLSSNNRSAIFCPYEQNPKEYTIKSLPEGAVRLMYLERGEAISTGYKIFNETLELPPAGRARVKLLYEVLGISVEKDREYFSIVSSSSSTSANKYSSTGLKFSTEYIDGKVMLSKYIDVNVPSKGAKFTLHNIYDYFGDMNSQNSDYISARSDNAHFLLKPGTRNLLIVRQSNATSFQFHHEILQDNDYRISMLYQLAPHLLIAMADVMFSVTGLEFSYAMAPESMKSVILGAWHLTTAIGNAYTVVIESLYTFTNIADKFFFYAAFLVLDMIIFALMGYNFKSNQRS